MELRVSKTLRQYLSDKTSGQRYCFIVNIYLLESPGFDLQRLHLPLLKGQWFNYLSRTTNRAKEVGQVVSVLAFYSNDPSSNLTEVYNFSDIIVFERNENIEKEARIDPFSHILRSQCHRGATLVV